LLFEDNFDDHPDWDSGVNGPDPKHYVDDGKIIPSGWYGNYNNPVWAPHKGDVGTMEGMYISSAHSDKARGGIGKSLVQFRESSEQMGPSQWKSDTILSWFAGAGITYPEIYVEFYISLSPEWIASYRGEGPNQRPRTVDGSQNLGMGSWKMVRAYYWDQGVVDHFHQDDTNAPRHYWGLTGGLTENGLFGHPYSPSYRGTEQVGSAKDIHVMGPPAVGLIEGGAKDCAYSKTLYNTAVDGGPPQLLDKKAADGSYLTLDGSSRYEELEQVLGKHSNTGDQYQWTKCAFYLKINSASGVQDGEHIAWIDDQRVFYATEIDWNMPGAPTVPGWNVVALGGNSYFDQYPEADKHHEWVAFDDFKIYSGIPHSYLKPPE
jgi:hypothetical protein